MSASSQKESWRSVGSLIEPFDKRNSDGCDYPFYGINKDKTFMPTVADTNNLDNTKYKIVSKGDFVFSGMQTGRDVCIRIALYDKEDPIIISPAYTTFRIKDSRKIIPQYLFIQFNRFEMDRYGWFLSDGSIRSNLDWDRFCDIEIPLPSIEVQQELVDTYNGLKALAEQNEALIEPLSKACEAFIVDCKTKYPEVELGEYIEPCDERNSDGKYTLDDVRGISIQKKLIFTKADMQGVSLTPYKLLKPREFSYVTVTSRNGGKISLAINDTENTYIVSSSYENFRCKDVSKLLPEYLFLLLSRSEFDRYSRFNSWGSARETFDWSEFCRTEIPLPPIEEQRSIVNIYTCLEEAKKIASEAREKLKTLCPALVQRAANS